MELELVGDTKAAALAQRVTASEVRGGQELARVERTLVAVVCAAGAVVLHPSRYSSEIEQAIATEMPELTMALAGKLRKPLSDEQRAIVAAVQDRNVIVDAVAGAGKTTTIVGVVDAVPRSIVLTYNSRLRVETEQRIGRDRIVFTFHGLATRLAGDVVWNDGLLKQALDSGVSLACPALTERCELLVIDEIQDMTPLLYRLVRAFLDTFSVRPRLLLLGDHGQCVYRFAGADPQFLTEGDRLFGPFARDVGWLRLRLSTTYRFGITIASFVNDVVLCEHRINALPDAMPRVTYAISSSYEARFLDYMTQLIRTAPESWMVLAPYLVGQPKALQGKTGRKRSCCAAVRLANHLAGAGIHCHLAGKSSDLGRYSAGKCLFLTFAKAKGLERDNVLVFGFDRSLADYHGQTLDSCPPEIYVACTRARRRLIVVQAHDARPFPFLALPSTTAQPLVRVFTQPAPPRQVPKNDAYTVLKLTERASLELCEAAYNPIVERFGLDEPRIGIVLPYEAQGMRAPEHVGPVNAFVLGMAMTAQRKRKHSALLESAVHKWTRYSGCTVLKHQLTKPYAWIDKDVVAATIAQFHHTITAVLGRAAAVELDFSCGNAERALWLDGHGSVTVMSEQAAVRVTNPDGEKVLVILITEPFSREAALAAILHVWTDRYAHACYAVYSFAEDTFNVAWEDAEDAIDPEPIARSALEEHLRDRSGVDRDLVARMLAL